MARKDARHSGCGVKARPLKVRPMTMLCTMDAGPLVILLRKVTDTEWRILTGDGPKTFHELWIGLRSDGVTQPVEIGPRTKWLFHAG